MENPMITFDKVSYTYEAEESGKRNLDNINFTVNRGECIVLCGSSGCGKTTVTRLINGLIPHHYEGEVEGKVFVDGKDIAEQTLAKTSFTVGSVFQNPRSQFFNVDTTNELVFGCENQALPIPEIKERLNEVNALFQLDKLINRSIFELSGGEKQRIACASVYATHPEVIVLDEPSSNLDAASIAILRNTIALLKQSGKTIVVSEHRLYYLADLADRFFFLKEGRLEKIYSAEEMRALSRKELASMSLRELDLSNLSFEREATPSETTPLCEPAKDPQATPPLLAFKDLVCCHEPRKVAISIEELGLHDGSVIAVIGHNGAGKSTFAHCLCGLQKHKGTVFINKQQAKPKQRITKSYMVMQDVNHQLFTDSVLEEVTLNAPEIPEEKVDSLLSRLGLTAYKEIHPLALSGGQKQRVAIASAICSGKEFLIYDEPTSGLDFCNMKTTCKLIEEAAQEAALSLVVTHDLEFILSCCTSVLHISEGKVLDHYSLDTEGIEKVKKHFLVA